MECEVCGSEVKKGFRVIIEGSEVTVCKNCKELGVESPLKPPQTSFMKKSVNRGSIKSLRKSEPIIFTEELIENFNLIIKREREKRGWSQGDLARKIQEKESLIRKIENADIIPEPEVIEKLERVFNIKLREKVQEVKVESKKALTPTLGDVVIIKRK